MLRPASPTPSSPPKQRIITTTPTVRVSLESRSHLRAEAHTQTTHHHRHPNCVRVRHFLDFKPTQTTAQHPPTPHTPPPPVCAEVCRKDGRQEVHRRLPRLQARAPRAPRGRHLHAAQVLPRRRAHVGVRALVAQPFARIEERSWLGCTAVLICWIDCLDRLPDPT
jgi:hypothetical protein